MNNFRAIAQVMNRKLPVLLNNDFMVSHGKLCYSVKGMLDVRAI